MILTLQQIQDIIKNNPNKVLINKGIEYSRKMRRHIYGEGMKDYLTVIEGFEKPTLRELRVKYSKSNKDLFSRLGRPIDKVFSARGGSIYFSLPGEQENKARVLTQDVRNGYTLRKWVESFWKPHFLDDPFGLIFMELLPVQEAIIARSENRSFVYPTYKSISTVFDYQPKGNKLEYIVFTVTQKEKVMAGQREDAIIHRVVDDAFDYWVITEGETVSVVQDQTFPNYFGEVPAIINSDIPDPECENAVLSFYDEIIELADHFLLKGSIKITHDFMHGFPKYSEFADDCDKCHGSKFYQGETCPDCKGTGKKIMTKVSDVKLLTWPGKDETVILPNQVGGYISPDKTFYEISSNDLFSLEDVMNVTLWGAQSKLKTQGLSQDKEGPKTATEIMDEIKPQADRLYPISEMAEKRHKFILDHIIRLQISMNYPGSSVNYGRRYMIESPDVIWEAYNKARKEGSPQNLLDDLLNDYYDTKYQSDPVALAVSKKLIYVEPFVHYTAQNLQTLGLAPDDYNAKLYYPEWLSQQSEGFLISSDAKTLKEALYAYVKAKNIPLPKEKEPIAA